MHTLRHNLTLAFLALAVNSPGAYAQTTVYDNTATSLEINIDGASFAMGNQVVLGGSNRIVVELAVVVHTEGDAPATLGLEPYLLGSESDPTPFGGEIWHGSIHPETVNPGVETLARIPIPQIEVPDEFTWAIRFWLLEGEPTSVGFVSFYPPALGSVPEFGFWRQSTGPNPWVYQGSNVRPFGARIKAVPPIPATSTWGLIVFALLIVSAGTILSPTSMMRSSLDTMQGRTIPTGLFCSNRKSLSCAFSLCLLGTTGDPISAQVLVGLQVRLDVNGGTAAANETSVSAVPRSDHSILAASSLRSSQIRYPIIAKPSRKLSTPSTSVI
jgi:hypothetical protein